MHIGSPCSKAFKRKEEGDGFYTYTHLRANNCFAGETQHNSETHSSIVKVIHTAIMSM